MSACATSQQIAERLVTRLSEWHPECAPDLTSQFLDLPDGRREELIRSLHGHVMRPLWEMGDSHLPQRQVEAVERAIDNTLAWLTGFAPATNRLKRVVLSAQEERKLGCLLHDLYMEALYS